MKTVFVCMLFLCSLAASAQGLIGSHVDEMPSTLKLVRGGYMDVVRHMEYLNGMPYTGVEVVFESGLDTRLPIPRNGYEDHIHCKGGFSFGADRHGMQQILVNRLDLCVDDDGVPQYVRPGISREQYDLLLNNITAELSSSPMGVDRADGKDVGEIGINLGYEFGASQE